MPTDAVAVAATEAAPLVRYEFADHVARITLNRPHALNAMTMAMEHELEAALRTAEDDPGVRCILITGAGRGFCAGDDVKVQWNEQEMADSVARLGTPAVEITPFVRVLLGATTPSIAAVNGAAVGFGMDLALMCDIRIAARSARFAQAYINMGLIPDVVGTWLLPQLVGRSRAAELVLTGELIGADEALALGLVSRVVDDDALVAEAGAMATRIAGQPPLAVAATKELLRRSTGLAANELDGLAALRGARLRDLFGTADHAEAVAAFVARRPATFHGR